MSHSDTRPSANVADAKLLLADHYGLKALKVTELVSFDSRNFSVVAEKLSDEEKDEKRTFPNSIHISSDFPSQSTSNQDLIGDSGIRPTAEHLVLKVFNKALCTVDRLPVTTKKIQFSQFLRQCGFLCPDIIYTNKQELFSYSPQFDSYAVLMTKLPGNILAADKSKLTCSVLYELGVVLALMHEALQECDSEYLETDPDNPWCLENLHLLTDYLPCIQDQEERNVLSSIIEKFHQIRVNTFHLLQKGIIHGDFHDWNLIVDWQDSPTPRGMSESATSATRSDISDTTRSDTSDTLTSTTQVPRVTTTTSPTTTTTSNSTTTTDITRTTMNISINTVKQKYGIIDFEEMSFSYPVLELCRLVADMMVDCTLVDLLEIGGHVIAGYTSVKGEPVKQFSTCFYDTVLACLAQYVVLQNYEYQAQAGDNDYCLEGADGAKVVINKLKGVTSCDLYKKWVGVLKSYGLTDVFGSTG